MAKLLLTDEEIAAHSWLDLDDASLGKVLKHAALTAGGDDCNAGHASYGGCPSRQPCPDYKPVGPQAGGE